MTSALKSMVQVNLQTHFGGGEVYTAFLTRVLSDLGVATRLFVHAQARFWASLNLPVGTEFVPVQDMAALLQALPNSPHWVLSHGSLPEDVAANIAKTHYLTAIAHMPPQGRERDRYPYCNMVFPVSEYVRQGLLARGVPAWTEPLYGVANLDNRYMETPLRQTSCYDWDQRKGRDRLLGWMSPLLEPLRRRPVFTRQKGITLGIVSRITPIKQLPLLLSLLVPVLARHPTFKLEIFGSGGYASVRDLKRVLAPLGKRVRWWGHQQNVASVYRQLDYLLTGLPEKEALGLNVIEAQALGTPVLAVAAPPFTETILDKVGGYLYPDPRLDQGNGFENLLNILEKGEFIFDDECLASHLQKFTIESLRERVLVILLEISSTLNKRLV